MAWHFARYHERVASAGKRELPLPMFANAALIRPGYLPGRYVSAGPLPHLSFCPTGGVTLGTAPDYLALANVPCVGGTWITPKAALAARDFDTIGRLAREAAGLRGA